MWSRLAPRTEPWWKHPYGPALAGALVTLAITSLVRGRIHPDEVFQYLEPAYGFAFGQWMVFHEWESGLRNWAFPGLLGCLFKALWYAGLEHPWIRIGAVWGLCAALQALATVALYRLVEERDGKEPAVFASWVHVTWGCWALYAARPLGDVLSVATLLPAFLWVWRAKSTDSMRQGAAGGLFLGLSVIIRYPSGVFALPLLASLVLHRRWRALAGFMAAGLAMVISLAILDWCTWGAPLHSVWKYFSFNILEGKSVAVFGRSPWWWYLPILAGMAPILLAYHFAKGLSKGDLLVGLFLTYLGIFSLIGHKEARFLVPLLPLWVMIAAAPALRDFNRIRAWSRRAFAVVLLVYLVTSVISATTHRTFGIYRDFYDATVTIGREPRLTGLILAGLDPWNTGGRVYLGRAVPLFVNFEKSSTQVGAALVDPVYSHALVRKADALEAQLKAAGFEPWKEWRRVVVWQRKSPSAAGK